MPKRAPIKEFKPQVRSARTIIDAIAFLQKTGFSTTPDNIKTCILQRSRKPAEHIMDNLSDYLTRGLELGILKKRRGNYRLGDLDKTKSRKINNTKGHIRKVPTTAKSSIRSTINRTISRRTTR